MSRLIPQISQKLVRDAKKNARPSTYSRLVPQSPKSRPAACFQPTLRGRSADKRESAAGLARPCTVPPLGAAMVADMVFRASTDGGRLRRRGPGRGRTVYRPL